MTSWRSLVRALHRDIGFFIAGVTLLYAISGIAVNHTAAWDPSFVVERRQVAVVFPAGKDELTEADVLDNLERLGIAESFKTYDFPSPLRVKIYLEDGSIVARLGERYGTYETIRRRPFLYEVNFLHLNPRGWWKVFSDLFAVALIFIVVTGLILTPGRRGLNGRGKWLLALGLLVPLMALVTVG